MEFIFIERGNRGRVEYDFEPETYSGEYDGDCKETQELFLVPNDEPTYTEMDTGPPPDDAPDDEPVLPEELYAIAQWDEQLRSLPATSARTERK